MKVVFIEDVPDVALAGETKEVADGYGRNYLLPKKLAVIANSGASNIVKAQMKQVLVKRAQAESEMKEVAGKIDGVEITIKAKAGEKERLYGSVTSADIAAEIGNVTGMPVDKRKIELEEPIRQLGVHDITVKFTHDITAAIKVTVEADAVAEEKEEKEEKKPRARKAKKDEEAVEDEVVAAEEEAVSEVETAVPVTAEAPADVPEAEVKAEDTAVAEADAEVKVEESEVPADEPEAEVKAEKPKAKRKSKKKTEPEVEEQPTGE